MWFPYTLPMTFKIEGDRQNANDSQLDDAQRDFLVAFQLRNPVSNEWSVELQLQQAKALEWKEPSGNLIQLSLFPNDDRRLSEAVCKLSDTGLNGAIERSHRAITTLLDLWSSASGRGFSVAGLRAADLKHEARWRAIPHWPSALDLPLDLPKNLPASFWSAAHLYREGRTSSKDRYRFLCCYALLSKWMRADPPFDWRNGQASQAKELADVEITQETMALSGAMHAAPYLEGLPIERLPEALAPWHEKAATLLSGQVTQVQPDDFKAQQEWAAIANVTDIAAHSILSRTIAYWRAAAPQGVTNKEHAVA